MSSEICIYCGTNRIIWNQKGKIGCIHCLKLFRKEYQTHIRQKDFMISSRFLQGQEFESFLKFESLSESEKILELDKIFSPFTYRLRIGRNLSGRIYPIVSGVPTQILKEFLTQHVDPSFLKTKELPQRIPWGEGNFFSEMKNIFVGKF